MATTLRRPRNVGPWRAAAILYGDWGTSKAYVTGLAFAIAMYSSFWLVLAVCALTLIVGINYVWVCKYFPDGGGVYSSARAHSKTLAMVGGLLLVTNYIVTAAMSAYVAFHYFGFDTPEKFGEATRWASVAIFVLGALNFLGPRHSGSLAVALGVITAIAVGILAVFCMPHLVDAVTNLRPPPDRPSDFWVAFVGAILALSGVESIANLTGLMKLDPGATDEKPSIVQTARRAITPVMFEVCLFTALFGLAMLAIPGMGAHEHEGNMLRHMASEFVDKPMSEFPLTHVAGVNHWFSQALSWAMGLLLLSAASTALIGMISVLYVMAQDGELPQWGLQLNKFGVPWILLLLAIIAAVVTVEIFSAGAGGIRALADLYAIGVVGTIAVNLGSCVINRGLPLLKHERIIMTLTALLMVVIWVTIAYTKTPALIFASIIIAVGFVARLSTRAVPVAPLVPTVPAGTTTATRAALPEKVQSILVAAHQVTPALEFAVEQARLYRAQLHVLFIRPIAVNLPITPQNMEADSEAMAVFNMVRASANNVDFRPLYAVSDDPAATILDVSASIGADYLILGGTQRGGLERILRGDLVTAVARDLPENIKLIIYG